MQNEKKKILIIAVVVLVAVLGIRTISKVINKYEAKRLAEYAEEQFYNNDFDAYVKALQNQGIGDLNLNLSFYYDYEDDYDKKTKTLYLSCRIENMESKKIDYYFTTEYNGVAGTKLAGIMEAIKDKCAAEYTYMLDSGEVVVLSIEKPDYYLRIYTPSGREYEYSFNIGYSVTLTIDDDWVYYTRVPEPYYPGAYGGECKLGHCDFTAKEGSNYCSRHGCCKDGCTNQKDPMVHCCDVHNCKESSCGMHRYDAMDSEYCKIHYVQHYSD